MLKFCGNVEFVYLSYKTFSLKNRLFKGKIFLRFFFQDCDFDKSHFMYQFKIYRLFCILCDISTAERIRSNLKKKKKKKYFFIIYIYIYITNIFTIML